MSKIFITGSADGLGHLAAKTLINMGHDVALHARNSARADETVKKTPGAMAVLTADLSSMEETKHLAEQVNEIGQFDVIIHNAGVYQVPARQLFAVNTLAPYILTCMIKKPQRLIYLSSGMHKGGSAKLDLLKTDVKRITYSDTKLHVMMFTKAVAEFWPDVLVNAVDPGWVPTKMGGAGAPDDLQKGYETQVWLATSNDVKAQVSGRYFFHKQEQRYNQNADVKADRDRLLAICGDITGVSFFEGK
ncbi:SDR family NAD(P)-dependent oxidoreductase [Chitinophaga sp.]|uniref:SDR family NAD(P)-dependent oxidoreductase n=1 Tax=Chitinophaga sp. TaxID=1869181 RepID=UPI0031DBE771